MTQNIKAATKDECSLECKLATEAGMIHVYGDSVEGRVSFSADIYPEGEGTEGFDWEVHNRLPTASDAQRLFEWLTTPGEEDRKPVNEADARRASSMLIILGDAMKQAHKVVIQA